MARPVGGQQWVKAARAAVGEAKSVHELRMAQAMLLPVAFGLNLNQVAEAIGQSVPTVTRLRQDFVRSQRGEALARARRGGQRNEHMTLAEEQAFLAPRGSARVRSQRFGSASRYGAIHHCMGLDYYDHNERELE